MKIKRQLNFVNASYLFTHISYLREDLYDNGTRTVYVSIHLLRHMMLCPYPLLLLLPTSFSLLKLQVNNFSFCSKVPVDKFSIKNLWSTIVWVNFIQKKVTPKKLSTNKWRKKSYHEVLSKKIFIQKVRDLFYFTLSYKFFCLTLYNNIEVKM